MEIIQKKFREIDSFHEFFGLDLTFKKKILANFTRIFGQFKIFL